MHIPMEALSFRLGDQAQRPPLLEWHLKTKTFIDSRLVSDNNILVSAAFACRVPITHRPTHPLHPLGA